MCDTLRVAYTTDVICLIHHASSMQGPCTLLSALHMHTRAMALRMHTRACCDQDRLLFTRRMFPASPAQHLHMHASSLWQQDCVTAPHYPTLSISTAAVAAAALVVIMQARARAASVLSQHTPLEVPWRTASPAPLATPAGQVLTRPMNARGSPSLALSARLLHHSLCQRISAPACLALVEVCSGWLCCWLWPVVTFSAGAPCMCAVGFVQGCWVRPGV